jgi:hypothetical protein
VVVLVHIMFFFLIFGCFVKIVKMVLPHCNMVSGECKC